MLAIGQMKLENDKRANLSKALELIERAKGCDIIVLPEMLMGRRTEETELYQMAEDVENGEFATALANAAKENEIAVCACLWEDSGTDKVYNTAMVYGVDGSVLAKYRKLHLFDALNVKESDFMLPGAELPPVFEIDGVKYGLSICYDLRFPELYRDLVRRGADVLLAPAAWYAGELKVDHLHLFLSARALENTCYSACANLCSDEFAGHSAVFAPYGEKIDSLADEDGLMMVDINLEYMQEVRAKLPVLSNYRSDVLG